MKKISLLITFFSYIAGSTMRACPTCVARVDEKTPPFFSEEFYDPLSEEQINPSQSQGEQ